MQSGLETATYRRNVIWTLRVKHDWDTRGTPFSVLHVNFTPYSPPPTLFSDFPSTFAVRNYCAPGLISRSRERDPFCLFSDDALSTWETPVIYNRLYNKNSVGHRVIDKIIHYERDAISQRFGNCAAAARYRAQTHIMLLYRWKTEIQDNSYVQI